MNMRWILLMSLAAAIVAPGTAPAGTLSALLNGTGITNDDYTMMTKAAARLYDVAAPKVGTEETWTNPATGAHGAVKLADFDGTCAVLNHDFESRTVKGAQHIQSRRCRAADGTWKLDIR